MLILRILGINAQTLNSQASINLREACAELVPDARFAVEGEIDCRIFDFPRLRRFAYRLAEKYDTGEDIVLIGSSAGGLVARLMASLLKKSRVRLIVTLFSPHTFLGGIYARLAGAPAKIDAPIISFQVVGPGLLFGWFIGDWLVWWGAHHPQAIQRYVIYSHVRHAHKYAIGTEPWHARLIARTIKDFLKA